MGGSAAGARLALGALGSRLQRRWSSPTATRCRAGRARRRWCCARATRATPRRRSRPTTTPPRAARRGSWRRPAGALAERARARRRAGDPDARRLPAAGGDRLLARRGAGGGARSAARRRRCATRSRRPPALAEALAAEWGPDGDEDNEAKALARALHGTVPVIAGAELAAAAAYRWKCQFNENAALPAFASALPEADHNEVVGWAAARELGAFSYVSLGGPGRAPAQPRARRADGGDRRAPAPIRSCASRARGDVARRAAGVAGPARRPGLDLRRRAARRGSGRHPRDRRR